MKSKTSCFNKTIFKKNITRFWAIWLSVLLWNLFVLPCNIFICYLHRNEWISLTAAEIEAAKISDITGLVSVYMNPVLLCIFATAAAMAVFSYLYTFRAANTIHALPVTRKELFVTNYLSGLLFQILPLFVGFLTGTIVGAACGYTSLDYIFKGMLYAVGMSFFFYNFAVFVAMVAGTLSAIPVFVLILNYLYVGCKLLVNLLEDCISYGVSAKFQAGKMDIFSPLYYIVEKVQISFDYSGRIAVCKGILGGNVVIGYALAAIPFLAGAYLIYKKRDVETAGSLISVSWITPIFRWGTAFCGALLLCEFTCQLVSSASASAEFWVALISALLYGSVIFFCVQMVLEKGFRVFKKKRFMELGVFLVFLLLFMSAMENDWFGIEKRVPKTEEIQRAYIYNGYPIGGEKQEDIDAIRDIHAQCVKNKQLYENAIAQKNPDDRMTSISVKYFLQDGNTLERYYTIPVDQDEAAYQQVEKFITSPEGYLKNQFGMDYTTNTIEKGGIDIYENGTEYQFYEFTQEEAQMIYQALLADLEAGNMDYTMEHYQWYDEEYENKTYFNTISLEYTAKEKIRYVHDAYYREREGDEIQYMYGSGSSKEGSTSIDFTEDCENIIQTLVDMGAIESKDDLICIAERNKMEE